MNQESKKAILFFSRTAEEEASHKLLKTELSQKGNIAISQSLIDSTLDTISSCNYPLICCYSPSQKGESFGVKLANAIEDVFNDGFEQIIVLGNDCPSLMAKDVNDAFDNVVDGDMTLGPTKDGGVYLLGLNKDHYVREDFVDLDWEQSSLQESLIKYSQQLNKEIVWLEELLDIDTSFDLVEILRTLPKYSKFKNTLQNIVSGFKKTLNFLDEQFQLIYFKFADLTLRGPPVV